MPCRKLTCFWHKPFEYIAGISRFSGGVFATRIEKFSMAESLVLTFERAFKHVGLL